MVISITSDVSDTFMIRPHISPSLVLMTDDEMTLLNHDEFDHPSANSLYGSY